MGLRYGRIRAAAMLAVVVAVLAAGSASAAEPPADVVLDATVTVHLPASTHGLPNLAGAVVRLEASRADGEPFQILEATAGAEQELTFSGVARAADGAPDVLLDVRFDLAVERVDSHGCTVRGAQSGSVGDLVASDGLEVEFGESASSQHLDCSTAPEVHDAVLTVRFIDAVTLLPVADAAVTVRASRLGHDDETFTGRTDLAGLATIAGLPRVEGLPMVVSLDVTATATETWSDTTTGCHGEDSIAATRLAVPAEAVVEVMFSADEQVASNLITCDAPTDPPGGGVAGITSGPGVTPPNTATGSPAAAGSAGGAAIAVLGTIGLALLGLTLTLPSPARARRRR